MIINTPNGAVLEVFWRERGSKPWSQVTAQRFLARFSTDQLNFQGARWILSDRGDTGHIWRAPDYEILQRAAGFIAANSLIVAQFGGTERWPGSGFVLGSGSDSALLFWRDQLHLLRDLAQVQEWISDMRLLIDRVAGLAKDKRNPSRSVAQAFDENKKHIQALRDLITSVPGAAEPANLDDDAFLQLVINYFRSGELLPIYHHYPRIAEPVPNADTKGGIAHESCSRGGEPEDLSEDSLVPGVCLARAATQGAPFVTISKPGEQA